MTSRVHAFDPREGGFFRISLTYVAPTTAGKTDARTDTYYGTFMKLVPDQEVVESLAFETADPAFASRMTITTTLIDADGDTDVACRSRGCPAACGWPTTNSARGWRWRSSRRW
jgi:hypothetical protein